MIVIVLFWSDPQPGTDDQRSNQVITDAVANADDLNLPGEDSCSFLQKNIFNARTYKHWQTGPSS